MAENPGIGDLLGMFGSNNPLAGIGKTVEQFKRGMNDFLVAVESFNKTMEQMAGVAERVNRLIDDVEPPIRAFMPQVTRVIETTESVVSQLAEPIGRVTPGIAQLAENLSAPSFTDMSRQLGEFLDTLGDVGRGLKPLINMAESVGGMFGLRGLGRLAGGPSRLSDSQPAQPQPAAAVAPKASPTRPAATKPAAAKPAAAKKATARTVGKTAAAAPTSKAPPLAPKASKRASR